MPIAIEIWQMRRIKGLVKKVDLDDVDYRTILKDGYGVDSSTKLTRDQANDLIGRLGGSTSNVRPTEARTFATIHQLRKLRYHAIACAIHYAPMKAYVFDSRVFEGEDLREEIRRRFEMVRSTADGDAPVEHRIPDVLMRQMYTDWINPTTNRMCVEGGYKQSVRHPSKFFFNDISPDEASYLIQRFREIHRLIQEAAPL